MKTLYQSKAVVHSKHHNVYGSSMVGHTHTAEFSTVFPVGEEREEREKREEKGGMNHTPIINKSLQWS